METVIITIVLVFVLVWAFRLEVGVAKANEALERIEKKLEAKEKPSATKVKEDKK